MSIQIEVFFSTQFASQRNTPWKLYKLVLHYSKDFKVHGATTKTDNWWTFFYLGPKNDSSQSEQNKFESFFIAFIMTARSQFLPPTPNKITIEIKLTTEVLYFFVSLLNRTPGHPSNKRKIFLNFTQQLTMGIAISRQLSHI